MALTDITRKIKDDAAHEARKITDTAEKKAAEISASTEEIAEGIRNEYGKELAKVLAENERRVISTAKQEVKHNTDQAKRELLDRVFEDALGAIALDEKKHGILAERLMTTLPQDISGTIYAPKAYVTQITTLVKKHGLALSVEPSSDFTGGFIIHGKDFEYNFTFEKLIADKKEELEIETSAILFA